MIALPLTSPYAFDVRRRATWQPDAAERIYTDFDVGWKGDVWTVSGQDSPNGANQYPGRLEWVRNADAFQDGVFFPSRAWAPTASGNPAAESLPEPWLAAGEPAVIPPPIQRRSAAGYPPPQEPPGDGETGRQGWAPVPWPAASAAPIWRICSRTAAGATTVTAPAKDSTHCSNSGAGTAG